MDELQGKTIIFTDLHCGLAGNKLSRLNICVNVVKEIAQAIKREGVRNVIFGGDWYHSRSTLDVNTINVSLKLVQAIAKYARLYLICGNHDSFLKNSTDVNSLNMFRDTPNVVVVDKPAEISLNGQACLLVPWLTDLSKYQPDTFDMMVGHFEISQKYLVQSYIEENSAKRVASQAQRASIDGDSLLSGTEPTKNRSGDLVGNFVDLVKSTGVIYAGHIHKHKEFIAKGRRFVFVGSPYQQTLGEIGLDCGYYVLDDSNRSEFHHVVSAPKHVQILMSKVVDGSFDFRTVHNSIIQKVYDVDIDQKTEASVSQRINDFKPYEELLPDYQVSIDGQAGCDTGNSQLELIRKSKVEYMRNYVDNIQKAALDEQGLDREKLFNVLERYYAKVAED